MRLFLPQTVGAEEPTTPPFLSDREDDTRVALLRETTQFIKEGKQRLPTPEKMAIMNLSTSFEKRRLGKQQQILTEMTQRCREQEVNDLSCKITAKCDLKAHGKVPHANPFYSTTNITRGGSKRFSEGLPEGLLDAGSPALIGKERVNTEKAYKFFPARHIIRQQTKVNSFAAQGTKTGNATMSKKGRNADFVSNNAASTLAAHAGSHYALDTSRFSRHSINGGHKFHHVDLDSPRRVSRNQQLLHSKADPLAPLGLPRHSMVDTGYQDRLEAYFSTSKMASRSKTFLDNGSISGRSYRSMLNLSSRGGCQLTVNGKNGFRSDRSDHGGLMNIPFQHDDDHHSLESIGRGFGQSVDNLTG